MAGETNPVDCIKIKKEGARPAFFTSNLVQVMVCCLRHQAYQLSQQLPGPLPFPSLGPLPLCPVPSPGP